MSYLASASSRTSIGTLKLILTDYNREVLEVATIPNLLLAWAARSDVPLSSGFIDLTNEIRDSFLHSLKDKHIACDIISGAWSPQFVDLLLSSSRLTGRDEVLIIACETIYSPDSVHQFTATLVQILQAVSLAGSRPLALIATKRVYFGVGGGLDDFLARLQEQGGQGQTVWQSQDGVRRDIVAVSLCNP